MPDAVHQAARPNEFRGQQAEPEKNHQHSRSGRDKHHDAYQQQGETSDDEEDSADLLNRAEDHLSLRQKLSGGEGGI